jgi:hypothetical protein
LQLLVEDGPLDIVSSMTEAVKIAPCLDFDEARAMGYWVIAAALARFGTLALEC